MQLYHLYISVNISKHLYYFYLAFEIHSFLQVKIKIKCFNKIIITRPILSTYGIRVLYCRQ